MDGRIAAISGAVFGGVLLAGALAAGPAVNLNPFTSTDAPAATTAADAAQSAPSQQDTGVPPGDLVAVMASDRSYGDEEPVNAGDQDKQGEHDQKHDHAEHEEDD
jgi:hypothetical protein